LLLGAHRATVGGRHKALESGAEIGCRAVQIFTSSPRQWAPQPITDDDLAAWFATRRQTRLRWVVAHDSYLINLAAVDPEVRRKSITAFAEELARCDQLDIPYLVTHPGAHVGAGEPAGLESFAAALRGIYDAGDYRTVTLLETTAGQGTCLGWHPEQLAWLIERLDLDDRVAACADTCHLFAAGFDLRTDDAYDATIALLDSTVGLSRLKVWHLNDSKGALGSRLDRHEQIGEGQIGDRGFGRLVCDPRFEDVPLLLETPDLARHADGLRRLRRLRRSGLREPREESR